MKRAVIRAIGVCALVVALVSCAKTEAPSAMPVLPIETSEDAILVAQHTWKTLYEQSGNQAEIFSPGSISKSEPYIATLRDGIWSISGSKGASQAITTVRAQDGKVIVGFIQDPS